ncbi:serine racemase [Phellopilus nigrolimitatus]|nr:serine racemase [Phellopilus nigrolimitatus]
MASHTGIHLNLLMKCENLQKVGAFKIRGATNAILSLTGSQESDGGNPNLTVITHSSGNHAQALAYASRALGVSCQVVMPSNSASVKKDAMRGYGATVTECVPTLQAREDGTNEIINNYRREGKKIELVPPYDDVHIIAGQGTLVLEMVEQAKEKGRPLDVLITPVGGGGMLSGCAVAAKGIDPGIWVIGAEPEAANDAYQSFTSKTFVPSVDPKTIADGLRTSLGQITYPLILKHVDAIHTVSEDQIIRAMKLVYERMKLVIEPSSAVTLAVVLYSREFRESLHDLVQKREGNKNELNIGMVFSGGNVDLTALSSLFANVS